MLASDVVAACSVVIALAAVGVSVYQSVLSRQHNRRSVRPALELRTSFRVGGRAGLRLTNAGLGPAVITRSECRVDEVVIGEFDEETANRLRGEDRPRPSATTFLPGAILAAGYDEFLLSVDDYDPAVGWHADLVALLRRRLTLIIHYTSLYGELTWTARWPARQPSTPPAPDDAARLILVNGPPGVGKSTLARLVAQHRPMTLALDIDEFRGALGRWRGDPAASGRLARRLALAAANEHLRAGHDVVVGQYLPRTGFIEELEALAREACARFVEVCLEVDAPTLANRLRQRETTSTSALSATRVVVSADHAPELIASLDHVKRQRPGVVCVDAAGTEAQVLQRLTAVLARSE